MRNLPAWYLILWRLFVEPWFRPHNVKLTLRYPKRKVLMSDAILSWTKSILGAPTGYKVTWSVNGVAKPSYLVAVSGQQDASGYSQDFATSNPTVTLNPGDVVGASVQAVDAVNNLTSNMVAAAPVTVPAAPAAPGDPQDVTLALA